MEILHFFINLLTHTKDVLNELTCQYGLLIYLFLFIIILIETGLVIMPFLPGDSLLFTAGMLCASNTNNCDNPITLKIYLLIPLLIFAAVLGDNINYFVGRFFSDRVLGWTFRGKPLVKKEWIDDVHAYFEKYGTKTIIIARFMPIVRTVTPFVSGFGKMNYRTFLPYDIFGGFLWVSSVTIVGYFLGTVPFVEKHLEKFIIGIVILSVIPLFYKAIEAKLSKK